MLRNDAAKAYHGNCEKTRKGRDVMNSQTRNGLPQLKDIEQVSGGWVKKYILTYEMPDGREHRYESVSRKDTQAYREELEANAAGLNQQASADAVCIVPITEDDRLVMIKEFRYPLNSFCIAFPAGLMEPGEDIVESATRELIEETGYEPLRDAQGNPHVRILSQAGYSSAGMSAETVQVMYLSVGNEPIHDQATEENELIEVFTLPIEQIETFLRENTVPIGTRAQLILEAFVNARQILKQEG